MKKVFLVVCLVMFVMNVFAQHNLRGEKGISSIGAIAGYVIERESLVVGVDYRYNVLGRLRLAPSILYLFEKYNEDRFYLNADVHYLARISRKATIYPIAGIGASAWHYKKDKPLIPGETIIRFGVNLGVGGEVRLTRDILAGVEFKYNWTKQYYNEAMLMARVAYYF